MPTQDPKHEPAVGFTADQFGLLSTVNRAGVAAKGQAFDFGALMAMVMALIAQFSKAKDPAPTPVPAPPVVVPPVTTTPPVVIPPPVTNPQAPARKIVRGKSHILGIEGWSPTRKHFSLGGGTVRNIATGNDFAGAGYRIHIDTTPLDQNGQPFFNPDLHTYPELFAQDPTMVQQDGWGKWTCQEGNNRINHYVTVDGHEYGPMGDMVPGMPWQAQEVVDLTSEYDDGAFTPVLTVPQDIALSQEHTVTYRAEYVAPDGSVVKFDPAPTFKVKAWGF